MKRQPRVKLGMENYFELIETHVRNIWEFIITPSNRQSSTPNSSSASGSASRPMGNKKACLIRNSEENVLVISQEPQPQPQPQTLSLSSKLSPTPNLRLSIQEEPSALEASSLGTALNMVLASKLAVSVEEGHPRDATNISAPSPVSNIITSQLSCLSALADTQPINPGDNNEIPNEMMQVEVLDADKSQQTLPIDSAGQSPMLENSNSSNALFPLLGASNNNVAETNHGPPSLMSTNNIADSQNLHALSSIAPPVIESQDFVEQGDVEGKSPIVEKDHSSWDLLQAASNLDLKVLEDSPAVVIANGETRKNFVIKEDPSLLQLLAEEEEKYKKNRNVKSFVASTNVVNVSPKIIRSFVVTDAENLETPSIHRSLFVPSSNPRSSSKANVDFDATQVVNHSDEEEDTRIATENEPPKISTLLQSNPKCLDLLVKKLKTNEPILNSPSTRDKCVGLGHKNQDTGSVVFEDNENESSVIIPDSPSLFPHHEDSTCTNQGGGSGGQTQMEEDHCIFETPAENQNDPKENEQEKDATLIHDHLFREESDNDHDENQVIQSNRKITSRRIIETQDPEPAPEASNDDRDGKRQLDDCVWAEWSAEDGFYPAAIISRKKGQRLLVKFFDSKTEKWLHKSKTHPFRLAPGLTVNIHVSKKRPSPVQEAKVIEFRDFSHILVTPIDATSISSSKIVCIEDLRLDSKSAASLIFLNKKSRPRKSMASRKRSRKSEAEDPDDDLDQDHNSNTSDQDNNEESVAIGDIGEECNDFGPVTPSTPGTFRPPFGSPEIRTPAMKKRRVIVDDAMTTFNTPNEGSLSSAMIGPLRIGSRVWCLWEGDGYYYPAVIVEEFHVNSGKSKKKIVSEEFLVMFESGETIRSSDSALLPFNLKAGECNIYAELIKGKWSKVKVLEMISDGAFAFKVKADSKSSMEPEWLPLSSIRVDKKFFQSSNSESLKQKLFSPNNIMFKGISFIISIENKAEGKSIRIPQPTQYRCVCPCLIMESIGEAVRSIILEGGGSIMEFEELKKIVQEPRDEKSETVILIANAHRKTMKYYLALACGFPRVSSKWIFKCKDQNEKVAISEHFKLSNGFSKITGTETSHIDPGETGLFKGIQFVIVPAKKHAREDWLPLIVAGGGKVSNSSNLPTVTQLQSWARDRTISQSVLLYLGEELSDRYKRSLEPLLAEDLKIVNREWITQSFINQSIMDFSGEFSL